MDGLLWHFQTVWADSRVRWVVETTNPDVLWSAMAQTEDAHRQLAQAGNPEATCLLHWPEPEGILAVVADVGDANGDDE